MSTQFKTNFKSDMSNEYIYERFIDWPQLIEDIRGNGLSYSDIARIIGAEWSTLQNWRNGSEPLYRSGAKILLLHARQCGLEVMKDRVREAKQ